MSTSFLLKDKIRCDTTLDFMATPLTPTYGTLDGSRELEFYPTVRVLTMDEGASCYSGAWLWGGRGPYLPVGALVAVSPNGRKVQRRVAAAARRRDDGGPGGPSRWCPLRRATEAGERRGQDAACENHPECRPHG
jgi:hypothetical protein